MRSLLLTAAGFAALLIVACVRTPPRGPDPIVVSPPSSEFAGQKRDGPMTNPPPPTAGLDGTKGPVLPGAQPTGDWRQLVSPADSQRLLGLDEAWVSGLAAARRENAAGVDRLGVLLQPSGPLDSGAPGPSLQNPQPTPGDYRCRTIKLGGERGVPLVVYGWFRCRIELTPGGDLVFTKLTGSQRQQGRLFPYTDRALAFVGAEAWGNETTYPTYAQNPERDEVGALERIGPDRWRLLLAWPKQESVLDVIELVRES